MRIYCNKLNNNYIDKKVKLCGWISSIRIFKKIIFINLRDITGLFQIICKKKNVLNWNDILLLTNESCIKVIGIIKKKKNILNNLELVAFNIKIFNYSFPLPLNLSIKNKENITLKYRYLDLRRKEMSFILILRSKLKFFINYFFYKRNFFEIETPFLSKSFLEGANSFIVKSRLYKNKFYSLSQSPQIFKQLLMISGIDKYYQIVKCFRDENLRSDRQQEFTQIDIELSFCNFKNLSKIIEILIYKIWLKFNDYNLNIPFKKISYSDSLIIYGTDKPDLRNPVKFNYNLYKFLFKNYFIKYKNNYKDIKVLLIKNIINIININKIFIFFKKKKINKYLCIHFISIEKNKYFYKIYGNLDIDNSLINEMLLKNKIFINSFIIIFLIKKYNNIILFTEIRDFFCNFFKLFKKKKFYPIWIKNFPMFYIDKYSKLNSYHHPFTMPLNINFEELKNIKDYTNLLANSYDLVINGYELGSGSQRIHDFNIQKEIFNILNIKNKYDFFINSLKYGTPPHLGIALGLDRILMLLGNFKSIKDVIAFPKTNSGLCLLTGAPD